MFSSLKSWLKERRLARLLRLENSYNEQAFQLKARLRITPEATHVAIKIAELRSKAAACRVEIIRLNR